MSFNATTSPLQDSSYKAPMSTFKQLLFQTTSPNNSLGHGANNHYIAPYLLFYANN